MGGLFIFISLASHLYGLNGIKSKTVGNGQHGTARWASKGEIDKTYTKVNYEPQKWRTDEKSRPRHKASWSAVKRSVRNKPSGWWTQAMSTA